MVLVLSVTVIVMPVLSVVVLVHSWSYKPSKVEVQTPEGVENDESLDEMV
jgi:hypothetical protein